MGLRAIYEVSKRIYDILDNIFVFFYQFLSDLGIEALTGYKNITRQVNFPGCGNFPGYGCTGIKRVESYVEIQDMEIFQDMEA